MLAAAFLLKIMWKGCLWAAGSIPERREMYPKGYRMLLRLVAETLLLSGSPMTILLTGGTGQPFLLLYLNFGCI